MFQMIRGVVEGNAFSLQPLPAYTMLFVTEQHTSVLDDFLGAVLDESFINKAASDAAARSVCHFPVCCDRAAQCTG
jgi:hypothetical protein